MTLELPVIFHPEVHWTVTVRQAQARLAAQTAAVVLLVDSPQLAHLAAKLGAASTLPLLFTLHDLVTAVQQGANTQTRCALAADAVEAWD